jgi:hypothetical protein
VHFVGEWDSEATKALVHDVDKLSKHPVYKLRVPMVPWFPRSVGDIDAFSQATLDAGAGKQCHVDYLCPKPEGKDTPSNAHACCVERLESKDCVVSFSQLGYIKLA